MAAGRLVLGLVLSAGVVTHAAAAGTADGVSAANQTGISRSGSQVVRIRPAVPTQKPVKIAASAATAVAKAAKPETAKSKPAKKKAAHPTLKISIDLTGQRMVVRENGTTRHTWAISSGRKGYRTPTGHYRPQWMTKMHYSRKYDNAPMPHSIFFHHGYAIHATYATGALGRPASHGCIRLSPANAKRLFQLVQKHKRANTRIAIHGVAKDRAPAVARKKTKRRSTASSPRKPATRRAASRSRTTYSFAQPSYRRTWPGDPPRRRLRYGY